MLQQTILYEVGDHCVVAIDRRLPKLCLQRSERHAAVQPQSQEERLFEGSLRINQGARRQQLFCASSDAVRRRVTLQRIRRGKAHRHDSRRVQVISCDQHGVRIHPESEIRLARPVLQIMFRVVQPDAVRDRPREVRDLVLLHSALLQALARGEVEVGGAIVVGNKVRVIAAAAGQQLGAQPRVLIHLQHVHADVRYTAGEGIAKRKLPTLLGLVRQARDQVNANVADSSGSQPRNVVQRDGPRVQAADRRRLLVHERLHAQADAIDAAAQQGVDDLTGDGAGRTLDGNLGRWLDLKVLASRLQ